MVFPDIVVAGDMRKKEKSNLFPHNPKGHLFIIGGGERPDSLMSRFLDLAGGGKARVLVIPFSGSDMDDSGNFQVEQFERIGCEYAGYIKCTKEEVDSPDNLARLDGITAVFFSGGDQNKHTEYLLGTQFLEKIRRIYKDGGVVGGSSAGAAVMSKIMITGKESLEGKDGGGDFKVIKAGNVQTAEGFGFITSAIIDQHFIIRKRQNRLISLVIENPGLKGVGIDESTAIIVAPDGECTVAGESGVMLFENSSMKANNGKKAGDYLSACSISLSILLKGEKFKL
jgi:cyanophycinase